jgi:hypothetical protein
MATIIYDIEQLYQRIFGNGQTYHIGKKAGTDSAIAALPGYKVAANKAAALPEILQTTDGYGVDIWLPVWFEDLPKNIGDNGTLFLPYCVMRLTGMSTIVRTPQAERMGSVKELYNVDDYKITLKGFFIDKDKRVYPDAQLAELKKLHKAGVDFKIKNYLTDIFLSDSSVPYNEQNRVVFTGFELPEVEGGRKHVKPFVFNLESDSVFTLIAE